MSTTTAGSARTETWDPFGTIGRALWIGGAQWAGKSTVARLLAARHRVTCYHYDYHDARAHWDRRVAAAVASGQPAPVFDAEAVFVQATPAEMVEYAMGTFTQRFPLVLDDLRGLVSGGPVIAEGWGLRPELVADVAPSLDQMVVMVPTEEFRQHQLATLDRAQTTSFDVSDPERAQRNRVDRDRSLALSTVETARRLGVRVIEVDGTLPAEGVADLVGDHFTRYLI